MTDTNALETPQLTSAEPQAKTIQSRYNYRQARQWLHERGRQMFGRAFSLHKEDVQVINQLLCYFLQDDMVAPVVNIALDKGIMLAGPVGCGKTALMCLMRCLTQPGNRFLLKSCRQVSFEFIQDGYDILHRYCRSPLYANETSTICFDDLGAENNLKYYGNECNVMAEILATRYDHFCSRHLITHLTTNLGAAEIESVYGTRVRSRMREMFNLIAFEAESRDKRQ